MVVKEKLNPAHTHTQVCWVRVGGGSGETHETKMASVNNVWSWVMGLWGFIVLDSIFVCV